MSKPRRRSPLPTSSAAKNNERTVSSPANPLQISVSRPASDDRNAWKGYWAAQGQPWRTEPEIDTKRQEYLSQRRLIAPDMKHGIYPFEDVKLNRADVEWLLATHENGQGPVNWSDESQRMREGVNLRGADLRQMDLRGLPLARLIGGLTETEGNEARDQPENVITVHMALARRHPEPGLLQHSDRGSQYTAADCRELLAQYGIVVSMSGKGDCYDNALMESFFGT